MKKVTPQEANKLIININTEIETLKKIESRSSTFIAATTENIIDARPDYNFWDVRNKITALQEKVRKIKHALNVFNTQTELPDTHLTIDQALVFMPQLIQNIYELQDMKSRLPKERKSVTGNIIDYKYANYKIKDAESEYNTSIEMLTKIQNALNLVNSTVKFDIPD